MIITRTPYRLALAGGGTDFSTFYEENEGLVISFTIDKYCFITLRYLPEFFDHKFRIVYNKIETVKKISEIEHPAVKAILDKNLVEKGIELHHDGDLPARSGVGSSSAFVVGMLMAVNCLKDHQLSKYELALQAIEIEQKVLKEKVGVQDQIASAYGGFNAISIKQNGSFDIKTIEMSNINKDKISNSILLVYTNIQRTSSNIHETNTMLGTKKYFDFMNKNKEHAVILTNLFQSSNNYDLIAEVFNESWSIKKEMNPFSITEEIQTLRDRCIKAGAKGVKIMGAGGGGFLALWIDPHDKDKIISELKDLIIVPIKINETGSEVILNIDSKNRRI